MERLFYIALILCACSNNDPQPEMSAKRFHWIISQPPVNTNWWLGGGAIPESTSYIVYDPLTAADLASSYSNLANPGTNNATPGVAPTLSSGWVFNGTDQYIDARASFGSSKTLVIWFEQFVGGTYGCSDNKLLVRPDLSPGNTRLTLGSNTDLIGGTQSGILALRAGQVVYRNGKKLTGSNLASFPAGTDYNIFIGARNNAGTPTQYGGGKVLRYALYNIALSDAQIEALTTSMLAVNPAASAYEAVMLASDPLVYFPMNHSFGSFLIDKVANVGSAAAYDGPFCGADGPTGKGKAFTGTNAGTSFIMSLDSWQSLINLDEFSASFWVKNNNSNVQARPMNIYSNTGAEYLACEIRNGNIALYFDESGGIWNTGALAVAPNNTWAHVVFYNSKIAGVAGIYLNGTKYEVSRSGTGYTTGVPDTYYPYILQSMTGDMCHVAFYDHALNQSEVNAIYQ